MPFSQSTQMSSIVGWLEMVRPRSVLDVGSGMGVYGLLARIFLDGERIFSCHEGQVGYKPARECPTRISGIEGFRSYSNGVHDVAYDEMLFADALETLSRVPDGAYEVVLAIDILEHLSRDDGAQLLSELARVAKRAAIVSTPKRFTAQHYDENPLEDHRSLWSEGDLALAGYLEVIPNGASWIVICQHDGIATYPIVHWVREGVSSHLQGDISRAEMAYQKVFSYANGTGELATQAGVHGGYLLGLLMMQLGRHDEARRYAGQALEKAGISIANGEDESCHRPRPIELPRRDGLGRSLPLNHQDFESLALPNQVFVELTTDCNLRCSYCAVSLENYLGENMESGLLEQTIEYLICNRVPIVSVNVHGETTRLKYWQEVANRLITAGIAVNIISNFARQFSSSEVVTLSRFAGIRISVDSFDRATLTKLRPGADPRIIIENLMRIRNVAMLDGRPLPPVGINCVISEPMLATMEDLVSMCKQLGVADLMLHNAVGLDGLPSRPRILADMQGQERQAAVAVLQRALALADRLEIRCAMDPSLRTLIYDDGGRAPNQVETNYFIGDAQVRMLAHIPACTETRDCLDPWSVMKIGVDGRVYCCCIGKEVMGDLRIQNLASIWKDTPFQTRRRQLLSGELPDECRTCPSRSIASREQLYSQLVAKGYGNK